jgi:hypothetical protein
MGKPDLNGKVDTINSSGSTNNSLLLAQRTDSQKDKESGSLSHFAKGVQGETKKLPTGRSFRNTGGQSFLKAAIFRNMEKNREAEDESKEDTGQERMIMSGFTNSAEKKNSNEFSLNVEKIEGGGSGDEANTETKKDSKDNSPKLQSNSPESSSNMISKSIMKRFTGFGEKK